MLTDSNVSIWGAGNLVSMACQAKIGNPFMIWQVFPVDSFRDAMI